VSIVSMSNERTTVWSVGHSNHPLPRLFELLRAARIDAVADVRSAPYSRFAPHFNRDPLEMSLKTAGIRYVFLGDALGGRPNGDEYYDDEGHALYGQVAVTQWFNAGLDRLLDGAGRLRVAMMCAEEDPTHCHRRLLVARVLRERGVSVEHIRGDGRLEAEQELDDPQFALFTPPGAETWRSTQSVSPRRAQLSSSTS
jgi:uncharacterized protein (DUF488 family)